jgi:hypothetical protein
MGLGGRPVGKATSGVVRGEGGGEVEEWWRRGGEVVEEWWRSGARYGGGVVEEW